jgi:hypothetical protein
MAEYPWDELGAVPEWPSWMHPAKVDSYSVEPVDRRVVTETEAGTLIRVEFPGDETIANCTLFCDRIAASWFEAFEHRYLLQGSRWMLMPLYVAGHLKHHMVRFKERPKLGGKFGDHVEYTFRLQVEKRLGFLTDELVKLLLWLDPYKMMDIDSRLQVSVNVAYPRILPFPEG